MPSPTRNILQVTPFLHVSAVDPAVRFFVDDLGFTAVIQGPTYAYVERDGAGVRLQSHSDAAELGTPHRGFGCYFDVQDVEALHAEFLTHLGDRAPHLLTGPIDQRYGQRELLIKGPDGNLVVFGQALEYTR